MSAQLIAQTILLVSPGKQFVITPDLNLLIAVTVLALALGWHLVASIGFVDTYKSNQLFHDTRNPVPKLKISIGIHGGEMGLTFLQQKYCVKELQMIQVNFHTSSGETVSLGAEDGQTAMRVAKSNDVPGIVAVCGGHAECGTCHVYVAEDDLGKLPSPSAAEEAMLEEVAAERRPNSRLSCQIKMSSDLDGLTLSIPEKQ